MRGEFPLLHKHHSLMERNRNIDRIRNSLRIIPILSRNQTLIQKKISMHSQTVNDTLSSDAMSLDNEEETLQPTFQHAQLFAEKYQLLEKIGEGSNGVVHRCVKKRSGKEYAVKSFMFDDQQLPELKQNFILVKNLAHRHIVGYEALYIDLKKHAVWLVMQLLPSLSIARSVISGEQELRQIAQQLLQTLNFMHKRAVTHRDVKMQNILYDETKKELKLIDFGICRKHKRRGAKIDMLTITGTLYYRAPQMFTGGGYNQKVDIWAVGILLYKLVTGRTPFQSEYHSQTINNIIKGDPIFTSSFDKYSPALRYIIQRMLKKNSEERLSASQCLRDAWFYPIPYIPQHKGSYNQIGEQEYDKKLSPKLTLPNFIGISSYVRQINGDEYHCIDSDEDGRSKHKKKVKSNQSLMVEPSHFTL